MLKTNSRQIPYHPLWGPFLTQRLDTLALRDVVQIQEFRATVSGVLNESVSARTIVTILNRSQSTMPLVHTCTNQAVVQELERVWFSRRMERYN